MRPDELSQVQALTADELIKRGQELLALGAKLLHQAGKLTEVPEPELPPLTLADNDEEEYSVGRLGKVTKTIAIEVAQTLKDFDRSAYGEALGLKGAALNKWLLRLTQDGRLQRYEGEEGPRYKSIRLEQPREHETKAPPETYRPSYELAQATGEPVRIRTNRDQARSRSTPGSRMKIINNERNWDRLQQAREERAEKERARAAAQKAAGPKKRRASRPVT